MKKYGAKLTAGLLTFAMTASSLTPAFAAPVNTEESQESSSEIVLSQTAKDNLAAARIVGSMGNVIGSTETDVQEETAQESDLKDAIKNWIFNGYDGSLDLSRFGIGSEEMDTATAEVLDETGMAGAAEVTYETDDDGQVTTAEVEMDPMVVMAAAELETVYNLSEEQTQTLLGMYSQYLQLCEDNADIFGVQVPYNTTRDTNASPIGSLLDIASIPEEYAQAGYIDYDTLSGIVQLYYLGTQFAVSEYADEIREGRNEALSVLEDGMTEMQEYLALNDWLADHCQFAMDYIMAEMVEPEPAENKLYTYAYNCMYNMIKQQVHDGTYDALKDIYGGDQAEAIATQQAEAYMVDVQEEGGSGEQQAASTASAIVGMWGSNQVGVFVNQKAVCFGYANVYAYLLQCAHPEIYLKDGETDINTADNWKSYTELNYELDSDGNPVKDEDGNYKWSENSAAIADYVKIIFDADVTMFGQDSDFGEAHYWNAVKLDGKWYYVDPCYVDIYVECMNRDRVETDGNLNHLYFMFSDDSCREMYEDNYQEIRTLYEGIATDTTYEEAWVAFVKSQPDFVGDKIYYLYDSTDLLDIMRSYGNGSSSSSRAADSGSMTDYEGLFSDTEYKIVYHDNSSMADTSDEFGTLIDFNNGQVYNPTSGEMEDNETLAELFEEHQAYVEEYPSISISCSYYNNKIYFGLSNCILSYELETGAVEKLIEYTEVSGERDMSQGLGGLAFTMTSSDPGTNGITVENPPIADMTIKDDGKMYVSVATNYAFISGKDFGQLTDYSSYGYRFAETNYEPSYNTYYSNSEPNDNDEFMWSANIVGTIDMSHLAGTSHSCADVTIPASCTEDEYTVSRCSECGLIQQTAEAGDDEEENAAGAGHTYIKFNETYYTKDDNGNWQTGTSYVCIDCGHAFELDDDETVEDHLRSNDKVLTDDEVAAYAGSTTQVWTWSTDKTEASMYTVPTELMSHKFDCIWENPSLSTREVASVSGDCTTGEFTATLASGETATGSVTAGNHSYLNQEVKEKDEEGNETITQEAAVQWTWADDLSTATVTFLCDVCGNKTTVEVSKDDNTDAKKMVVESTAATCTENGSDKYTATVVVDGVNYISSRTIETDPATGHIYGADGKCTICEALDTPVISSVYSKLQTTAKITWNKVTDAVGYELWRATSMDAADDEWSCVKTIKGDDVDKYTFAEDDTIRYTNVDLTVGQTYFYKVRAFRMNSADADPADGTARTYSKFSAIKYMPAAVVFDNVYSNSTSRIRILWEEVNAAHGYQIWRKADDGEYVIVKTIGDKNNSLTNDQGATTAYSNTGLEAGKTYTYKMRAFSIPEDGTKVFGAYSDEVTVAVMPEAPEISVKSSKAGKATISWETVNGAAGYQVWMADSQDGTYEIVKSIADGIAESYTKASLESGKTYYFKVRAYTEVEAKKTFGAYSEAKSVTVK